MDEGGDADVSIILAHVLKDPRASGVAGTR